MVNWDHFCILLCLVICVAQILLKTFVASIIFFSIGVCNCIAFLGGLGSFLYISCFVLGYVLLRTFFWLIILFLDGVWKCDVWCLKLGPFLYITLFCCGICSTQATWGFFFTYHFIFRWCLKLYCLVFGGLGTILSFLWVVFHFYVLGETDSVDLRIQRLFETCYEMLSLHFFCLSS